MTIVDDNWQGGRYDATLAQTRVAVNQIVKSGTIGAMSEALKVSMPDGWLCRGHECKVMWNDAVWKRVESGVIVIDTPPWKRGTSHRVTVELTWVLLKHRTSGATLLRVAGHLPAHLTDPAQRAANAAALKALPKRVMALAHQTGADEVSISLDLNRDLRLQRNQDAMNRLLRGTGLELVIPPKGTFGQRKIDCFIVSTGLHTRHMLESRKGFDHQGWGIRYHAEAA